MGHDWGGAISWTFSALHPGLLDSLVICNCPHMVAIRWELGTGYIILHNIAENDSSVLSIMEKVLTRIQDVKA